MDIHEIANPATSLAGTSTRRSKSSGIASEYSQILAEKIANVKTDVEKMNATQEKLDEIADLQEELTGEVKIDEDSGNANRKDFNGTTTSKSVETIKRFMPDGSILVTTYENGTITEQIKKKPHLQVVADYSAPPNPDGTVATKTERTQSLDLAALLMM